MSENLFDFQKDEDVRAFALAQSVATLVARSDDYETTTASIIFRASKFEQYIKEGY